MLPRIELEVGSIHEEIKLLFHRGSFRLREDFGRLELIRFLWTQVSLPLGKISPDLFLTCSAAITVTGWTTVTEVSWTIS